MRQRGKITRDINQYNSVGNEQRNMAHTERAYYREHPSQHPDPERREQWRQEQENIRDAEIDRLSDETIESSREKWLNPCIMLGRYLDECIHKLSDTRNEIQAAQGQYTFLQRREMNDNIKYIKGTLDRVREILYSYKRSINERQECMENRMRQWPGTDDVAYDYTRYQTLIIHSENKLQILDGFRSHIENDESADEYPLFFQLTEEEQGKLINRTCERQLIQIDRYAYKDFGEKYMMNKLILDLLDWAQNRLLYNTQEDMETADRTFFTQKRGDFERESRNIYKLNEEINIVEYNLKSTKRAYEGRKDIGHQQSQIRNERRYMLFTQTVSYERYPSQHPDLEWQEQWRKRQENKWNAEIDRLSDGTIDSSREKWLKPYILFRYELDQHIGTIRGNDGIKEQIQRAEGQFTSKRREELIDEISDIEDELDKMRYNLDSYQECLNERREHMMKVIENWPGTNDEVGDKGIQREITERLENKLQLLDKLRSHVESGHRAETHPRFVQLNTAGDKLRENPVYLQLDGLNELARQVSGAYMMNKLILDLLDWAQNRLQHDPLRDRIIADRNYFTQKREDFERESTDIHNFDEQITMMENELSAMRRSIE